MPSNHQKGVTALEPADALGMARAEAEAAIEQARQAHARLRDAIDILPEGIVFLDAEGRYILWNREYAEIYQRSADLFKPGARLEDTLRIGVATIRKPSAARKNGSLRALRISISRAAGTSSGCAMAAAS